VNTGIVRSKPGFQNPDVANLPRDTVVTVTESTPDGMWRHITWTAQGGGEGWMHRDVLNEPDHPRPGH
jgi:hypothetical protein